MLHQKEILPGDKISYLVPRDPSIQCWDDRVKLSKPMSKNLVQLGLDELEETMGGKIKVYLRLKPSTSASSAYTVLNSNTLQTEAPRDSVSYKNVTNGIGKLIHKFTFTSVLDQSITQSELFRRCAVKSITKFINGENYLLMAYGTTSAGKTFTMQGNVDQPGVIPRALDFVFNNLKNNIISMCRYQPFQYNELISLSEEQMRKDQTHKNFILNLDLTRCQKYPDASYVTLQTNSSSGFSEIYENVTFKEMQTHLTDTLGVENLDMEANSYKYSIWISMIEIYNEQVYDLLELASEKGNRTKLTFRDDENGNIFVKNLRHVNVTSGHEAFQILQFGRTNLHFAPTALNQSSSRSHCIFTITLAKFLDYESSSCAIMSRFSFCDLAGMERAKKTLNSKDRLVESKAINTSLSILVKCLTTIKENQNSKEKKLIPYRESKLTKLFREAVTGKEQFSLVVNVTTESNLFDETLNVLKFSAIAQKIVPQNVFVKPKITKQLKKSRFSQMVTNSSYNSKTIDWDALAVEGNNKIKEEYSSEIIDLQDLIGKLQDELAKERKRCEEIESDIREELTSKFSEMLKKQRDNNEARLENERERLEEMYEKKERRLIKYYEILRKNKRQRLEEDESREYEDQEQRLEELQKENSVLNSRNAALTERVQKLVEEQKGTLTECSVLKFTLAEKERLLEDIKKTVEAKAEGENSLVAELRRQLEEAKVKIKDYKVLLDEAASDYKELEENNKYLRNENEVLEQCLTEEKDAVADRANEIAELQKMLSQKRVALEKSEESNEKLMQQVKEMSETKESDENSMVPIYKKELESLREQFKITSGKLNESRAELEMANLEKLELEKELNLCKSKLQELESKLTDSLEKAISEKDAELLRLKAELDDSKTEREGLLRDKNTLQEKCNELNSEIKLLQKEIKDLLTEIRNGKQAETAKELDELKAKLSEQTEDMKAKERKAAAAIEVLQSKLETSERSAEVISELQNAIKTFEAEIAQKNEALKKNKECHEEYVINHEKEVVTLRERIEELENEVAMVTERINRDPAEGRSEIQQPLEDDAGAQHSVLSAHKVIAESGESEQPITFGCKFEIKEEKTYLGQSDSSPEKGVKGGKNKSPQKYLSQQMENLSLQTRSTRKKIDLLDQSVHPSTIKRTVKGRKKNEKLRKEPEAEKENEKDIVSSVKKKGKCYKKLFTDNDFDGLTDLNASPIEHEIPRLRPRK